MGNKGEVVSVIVPVYNVEAYVSKCLQSIVQQTYDNLEIIIIDDGSNDGSDQICEQFAKKDDRIQVIHQENRGLSAARNLGLDRCNGEYILFVDSDDYLDSSMIEKLMLLISKYQVLIATCDFQRVYSDQEIKTHVQDTFEGVYDVQKSVGEILGERIVLYTVVWNKLFHRSCFENLRFPEGRIYEDEFITYKLIHQAERVAITNERLYFYLQRSGSIVNTKIMDRKKDFFEAYQERIDFYRKRQMFDYYYKMLCLYRYWLIDTKEKKEVSKNLSSKIREYYRKEVMGNILKCSVSFSEKMGHVLYALCPQLYMYVK